MSHRHSKSASDSKEFEFNGVCVPPLDFEQPSPADDLFYEGRLLPLYLAAHSSHLVSRKGDCDQMRGSFDPASTDSSSSSSSSSPFSTSSTSFTSGSSSSIGSYNASSSSTRSEGSRGLEKQRFFKAHHQVGSWRKLLLLGSRKGCNKVAGLGEEGSLCKSCGQLKPLDKLTGAWSHDEDEEPSLRSIGNRAKGSWRKYLRVFRPAFRYPSSWSKQGGDDKVLLDKSSFFSGHLGLPTNKRDKSSTISSPLHHSGLLVSAADVQSAIAYCKQQSRPN